MPLTNKNSAVNIKKLFQLSEMHAASVLLVLVLAGVGGTCPAPCTCGYGEVGHINVTSLYITNCSHQALQHLPPGLPNFTQYLDISHNDFELVSEHRLEALVDLMYLDVRSNPRLHSLPVMRRLTNLSAIYVDQGHVCCIYELEWEQAEGRSRRKTAAQVCQETWPYKECSRRLMRIPSFVIYGITFAASLIFNPWIFVLTLGVKERRRDPFTLASVHFSFSNLMITVYAGGMLVVGTCFSDQYHYHMEEWLDNPACGALGFLLVTASLASTFFYTFEIIIVFLKVKYPFEETKHMSPLQLNIGMAVVWVFSFGIAAVPFGLGRYNAVGLCLPFYAGDYDFSFKFVVLYTCITNIATIFNMGLHIYVLKLFMNRSQEARNAMCAQMRKENRTLRNTVVITLVFYVLLSLSEMIFLIMSCVGGSIGLIGRDWWARMVVLEALINPLTGPMRSKRFYRHTWTALKHIKQRICLNYHNQRRRSTMGKAAIDLNKLKDKALNHQDKSNNHEILADSPSLAHITDKSRNGKTLHTCNGSDVSESPDLPRINLSWRSLRSAENRVSTISCRNLESLADKVTSYQTQDLGSSPMSKATLVSDVSDTDSERGIT